MHKSLCPWVLHAPTPYRHVQIRIGLRLLPTSFPTMCPDWDHSATTLPCTSRFGAGDMWDMYFSWRGRTSGGIASHQSSAKCLGRTGNGQFLPAGVEPKEVEWRVTPQRRFISIYSLWLGHHSGSDVKGLYLEQGHAEQEGRMPQLQQTLSRWTR